MAHPHAEPLRRDPTMIAPLLELRGIAKTYPGVRALRGVDFALLAGEVHALLGENGAGKSTMIKIIAGVESADAGGELRVGSESVSHPTPRSMQARGIAVVYQTPTLFEQLSVAENLCIGQKGLIVSPSKRREAAKQMLARIGASVDPDAPVCSLGIAEKQLLEIARAVHRQSKVLILDEPTASLSQDDARRLLDLVERLKSTGVGILYISHRLEEILRIADRFTVLRDGSFIATHERGSLDRDGIVRLMAGRDRVETLPKASTIAEAPLLQARSIACPSEGLVDASLSLHPGEILGLAGLVGAGRTEVARCLFGVRPASAGEILIEGKPVRIASARDAISLGIAYLPEDRKAHGVVEDMSVAENISLSVLRKLGGAWLKESSEESLATRYKASLSIKAPTLTTVVRTLSGGNQQKVALARWLATQPRILILDEPTQGIDVGTKAEIHRMIRDLANQGIAILLISSELPELLLLADRVIVMRQGRTVGTLRGAEATREKVLELAMEVSA